MTIAWTKKTEGPDYLRMTCWEIASERVVLPAVLPSFAIIGIENEHGAKGVRFIVWFASIVLPGLLAQAQVCNLCWKWSTLWQHDMTRWYLKHEIAMANPGKSWLYSLPLPPFAASFPLLALHAARHFSNVPDGVQRLLRILVAASPRTDADSTGHSLSNFHQFALKTLKVHLANSVLIVGILGWDAQWE